jgi:uncharacterized protein
MRSELRDKIAELLMEAIRHRERSILLFWLKTYCRVTRDAEAPAVSFDRLASFVARHAAETRWCGTSGERWGRTLVADSGLFRVGVADEVRITPAYRAALPLVCEKAAAYWECLKDLHGRSYPEGLPGVLRQAAFLWRHCLFFEFHELLEGVWMDWRGPERRFLQGLIQLGVAFYHIQRNNYRGAMSMFRNGWPKVAPHAPRYCGVDIRQLLDGVARCRELVERLGPGRCSTFDWSAVPLLQVKETRGSREQGIIG